MKFFKTMIAEEDNMYIANIFKHIGLVFTSFYVMSEIGLLTPLLVTNTMTLDKCYLLLPVIFIPLGVLFSILATQEKVVKEFDFLSNEKLAKLSKVAENEKIYQEMLQIILVPLLLVLFVGVLYLINQPDILRTKIVSLAGFEALLLCFLPQLSCLILQIKISKYRKIRLSILIPEYEEKLELEKQRRLQLQIEEAHLPWYKKKY